MPGTVATVLATVIPAVTTLSVTISPPLRRRRGLVKKLRRNREKLLEQVAYLFTKINEVQRAVENNKATKKRTAECEIWLAKGDQTIEEMNGLEARYEKASRFLYRMCAFLSRAKLSKDMEKKAAEIASLNDQVNPERALTDKEPEAEPFVKQSSKEKDELGWVRKNVKEFLKHLQNGALKKIGMLGLMGEGKTTIMRSLNDKAYEAGLFDYVIYVPIEDNDNEETIGQRILDQLKPNSRDVRSLKETLSRTLQNKKYLLLLDQVTHKLDLRKLGIRDEHEDGKVVVATRFRHICVQMVLDDWFQVEKMSDAEAWELFQKIAGEVADRPGNKEAAQRIVRECGKQALLIKAIAKLLRRKPNENTWLNFLSNLQSSDNPFQKEFDDLYNVFKVICHDLDDYRKQCFLYGALFPKDHKIHEDHLIECWRAEHFIPHAGGSDTSQIFRRAREDGHTTLEHLIDACLLERCREMTYVAMPPLFRIWALTKEKDFLGLAENPATEDRANARRILLKCTDLHSSLEGADLKMVSTLILQRNERLEIIPDSIFVLQSGLQVLDLGYTGIKYLPPSISNLIHLKALYLNDCSKLGGLPTNIRRLENLEILDICRTGISNWPNEIGYLARLKCLRVSFRVVQNPPQNQEWRGNNTLVRAFGCILSLAKNVGNHKHTEVQPNSIISRLSALEELSIVVDEDYHTRQMWNDVGNEIAREMASLNVLTALCFYFPSAESLATFIGMSASWNNKSSPWGERTFRSFKFLVGTTETFPKIDMSEHKAERHLKFCANDESPAEISKVLKQACTFELIGHRTIEHLSSLDIDSMARLKVCAIKDCDQMNSIIGGNKTGAALLEELKELHLINLGRLVSVCDGLLGERTLSNLTTFTINNCQQLSVILTYEMAQRLLVLEHLRVENCSGIAVIIEASRQDGEITAAVNNPTSLLSKLKTLELVNLPALQSICENVPLEWSSLLAMLIDQCPILQNVSLHMNNAVELNVITCHEDWWMDLNLENDVRRRFEPLCQLISQAEIYAEDGS